MTEDTKPLPVFTKYNYTEIALLHKEEKRMVIGDGEPREEGMF